MPTTWNAIYLGNIDGFDIDPQEGNSASEDAFSLVGLSAGDADAPLYDRIVEVTAIDNRGQSGVLDTSRSATGPQDSVRYDLGSGEQTEVFEGLAVYDATVTFRDGSTAKVSAVVFQDESGNLFLAPEISDNEDSAAYSSGKIVSLRLDWLLDKNGNLAIKRNDEDFQPPICFVAGTLIETPEGLRKVEDLRAGDLVKTLDHGAQPLRWVGSRSLDVRGREGLQPVRIRAGALGQGIPQADLLVSPQHRVLVRSAIAQRMFGTDEVLVAAKQLLALPGIEVVEDAAEVTYVHLLLERHELVISNGAVTETLFTGAEALKSVSASARAEIFELFPQLAEIGAEMEAPVPVRPLVSGRHGRKLADRHLANDKPVIAVS